MIGRDYYEQSAEASSRAGKEEDNDDEGTLEKGQEKESLEEQHMRDIDDFANEDNIFYGRCRGAKEAALNAFFDICSNGLTEREIEVYKLRRLQRYSHSEVAQTLGISEKTSRNHYSSAMAKVKKWGERK